jgi:hypothetical protein
VEYQSDWQDNIPYVELELDIKDVYSIYQSICFRLNADTIDDQYENHRIETLKDFMYRIILEFKYKVGE